MALGGSRGLIRISKNPECELQAALAVRGVKEKDFYESYTGEPYPGEYGERQSARRRGTMFEQNLHKNGAEVLRKAIAPLHARKPEGISVLNFDEAIPGTAKEKRLERMRRTLEFIERLSKNDMSVPALLIQPVLPLKVTETGTHYLVPDFLLLDRSERIYVPGEEKSFIVRDNVVDRADADGARRQAGAQVIGLRQAAERYGIAERVRNRAIFVFASPYGLSPAKPVQENVDAEVHEIEHALRTAREVGDRLARIPREQGLETVADDFKRHFTDECVRSCVLHDVCAREYAASARVLGDSAADLIGAETPLERVFELMQGAAPRTSREREVAPHLVELLGVFRDVGA